VELLTVEETSKYLGIPVNTLNRWRSQKKGPEFIKMGKHVKYSKEALDKYIMKSVVKTGD
jgi:excisionase family DNA binding protein